LLIKNGNCLSQPREQQRMTRMKVAPMKCGDAVRELILAIFVRRGRTKRGKETTDSVDWGGMRFHQQASVEKKISALQLGVAGWDYRNNLDTRAR